MRIYLNGTTDEITVSLASLVEAGVFKESPSIQRDDPTGQPYIQVHGDPIDPTTVLPAIPDKMIDRVTLRNTIYRGFRSEGLYEMDGAQLTIKTQVDLPIGLTEGETKTEWQHLHVSGPNIAAVVKIYGAVRSGKLQPTEDWEAPITTSDSKVNYFQVNFREGMDAMEAVWSKQDEMKSPRTLFSFSTAGSVASIWTKDISGEELFRLELQEQCIPFEEGDEQQIVTGME